MKKKFLTGLVTGMIKNYLIVFVLGILLLASHAHAIMVEYSFRGGITDFDYTPQYIVDELGLSIGHAVQYKFRVDFDLPGYEVKEYGGIEYQTDNNNRSYYFAEFVSGDTVYSDFNNLSGWLDQYYYAYDYTSNEGYSHGRAGKLIGGYRYDKISVWKYDHIQYWQIGDEFLGADSGVYNGESFDLLSSLTLTEIRQLAPVPEPSTILLMGIGLLGLIAIKSRKQKS